MPYTAITFADLKARLQARYESVPFWDDVEAGEFLNEGLLLWNLLTGRWHQRVQFMTTPGTVEYALPASLLYRTRVAYDERPMSPASRTDLNEGRPRWRQETTVSGGDVPTRVTLWAPVSLRLIYVWPADATGHHSLTLDGVAATPVLVNAGDEVDLAEADLSVLLGYALHVATLKKGGPWFQNTQPLFKAFLQAAAEENGLITTSVIYRRVMGLDHRDLKPTRDVTSSLTALVSPT